MFSSLFLVFFIALSFSQEVEEPKSPKVKFKNADNFITERLDTANFQYFRGNVKIFHDSIFMFADSATIVDNDMIAVGNVTIIQEDTINVFSDSLYYNAEIKLSELFDNVVLDSDGKQLFTNKLIYDVANKLATFSDTAIIKKDDMTLSSIRGYYDLNIKRARFYDEVVIIDDNIRLTADSLEYDSDIDRAYFIGPTYIFQDSKKIYCESGYYDVEQGVGFFDYNARIDDGNQTSTSESILYSEQDSSVIFEGNAIVQDSTSTAKGDKITYSEQNNEILIEGNGSYQNEDVTIVGPEIYYNEKTESLKTYGHSVITASAGILEGDTISYDKETDIGLASGDVIYNDTVEHRMLLTDELYYKDEISYYKASKKYRRPLFVQDVDGDTLFLSADTLIRSAPNDTVSFLQAMDRVEIYKTDLQAVCDSLYYSDVDSVFTLFGSPICWSDTTQFKGDTIVLQLANGKISDIIAKSNGFIVTKQAEKYYDQIKAKYIHSYLDSNVLKRMYMKGNSEAIYLLKDEEEAYMGVNKTLCSSMMFYFENEELDNIKFYNQPDSQMTPMDQAKSEDLTLQGFQWHLSERPKDQLSIRTIKLDLSTPVEKDEQELDNFEEDVLDIIKNEELIKKVEEEPKIKSKIF